VAPHGRVTASSPTAWRRWLANQMRRLRRDAGLEQKDVAAALRCSVSKVSYVESGERAFRPRDLTEILLPLYKVPEADWDRYVDACKQSRARGWWQLYEEDVVADWVSYYIGLEQGASRIEGFSNQFIHGLLQTDGYAGSLMQQDPAGLGSDEVDGRLEVRRKRQEALARPEPVELAFVLDEAVLRRVVGGPAIMHSQLRHLADVAGRPNVTLQVLPFAAGSHPDLATSFSILRFPWADDPGVVYIEHRANAEYLEAPHEVEDYGQVLDHLRQLALPPEESARMITDIVRGQEHR
jgi:transcriptional regulator with XRE-family HTH domain